MNINNLVKDLDSTVPSISKIVEGRILQYDADFACYVIADLEISAAKNLINLLDYLNIKRLLVGAEVINCFLTLGLKSGRDTMATMKPYQENRDPDAPIKVRVRELRNLLTLHNLEHPLEHINVITGYYFEADDLMCREQEKMIAEGRIKDSIIMSGDKDLWMVQGYHADINTGRLSLTNGYGETSYKEVGNVKPKLVGSGTSWFWHQMIMGDKADNITGLHKISNTTLDKYFPLKSGKHRVSGSGLCGETKAVVILKQVDNQYEAARRVYAAYEQQYGADTVERFIEQAYLLWMQRTPNEWDVLAYLKSCNIRLIPTPRQMKVISDFTNLRDGRI